MRLSGFLLLCAIGCGKDDATETGDASPQADVDYDADADSDADADADSDADADADSDADADADSDADADADADADSDDTGVASPTDEVDYCHIQWPPELLLASGDEYTVYVYVYEAGVTGELGTGSGIAVDLGLGPDGETPADSWTWESCTFNMHKPGLDSAVLDNDEYGCVGSAPAAGVYDYAARVSVDAGPWLYCDMGGDHGVGSEDGYSASTAGSMTVSD